MHSFCGAQPLGGVESGYHSVASCGRSAFLAAADGTFRPVSAEMPAGRGLLHLLRQIYGRGRGKRQLYQQLPHRRWYLCCYSGRFSCC